MKQGKQIGLLLTLAVLLLPGCSGNSGGGGTAPNIGGAAGEASSSKDAEITKAVQAKIDTHAELKAAGIQAKVAGGQVELTGTVSSAELKDKADDLAFEALSGYQDVSAGVLNNISLAEGKGN
jgi:hypothetical protein